MKKERERERETERERERERGGGEEGGRGRKTGQHYAISFLSQSEILKPITNREYDSVFVNGTRH